MQPMQQLEDWLRSNQARNKPALFRTNDFRAMFPEMGYGAYRALIHRAQQRGILERVCKGIYQYTGAPDTSGLVLFHAAALLRADQFNYISLETVLSDAGVISQVPMAWITLVSTGRTTVVDCGRFGHIEFVHTQRPMAAITNQLYYDPDCRLFRATTELALADVQRFHRHNTADLVQEQEQTHEPV